MLLDNVLSQAELIARLNEAPGVNVTPELFKQSLRPLFIRRGEAVKQGSARRGAWQYDATRINEWQEYLAVRTELIRRGTWHSKRPYDVLELEAIAQGNAHGEIVRELFPQEAQA